MASYQIEWKPSVFRDLKRITKPYHLKIFHAIESLSINPRPQGCEKLVDTEKTYRIRVGDYRAVYQIDDQAREVLIYYIGHRKDVYRRRWDVYAIWDLTPSFPEGYLFSLEGRYCGVTCRRRLSGKTEMTVSEIFFLILPFVWLTSEVYLFKKENISRSGRRWLILSGGCFVLSFLQCRKV